jgi:hypothetical protein
MEKNEIRQRENERNQDDKKDRDIYMGVLLKHFLFAELITRSCDMRHQVGGNSLR